LYLDFLHQLFDKSRSKYLFQLFALLQKFFHLKWLDLQPAGFQRGNLFINLRQQKIGLLLLNLTTRKHLINEVLLLYQDVVNRPSMINRVDNLTERRFNRSFDQFLRINDCLLHITCDVVDLDAHLC